MRKSLFPFGKNLAGLFWKRIWGLFHAISVKKNLTTLGPVTIDNSHPFSKGHNGFQLSGLMQEKMVYAGHLDCYQKCNEIIDQFLSVKVSASQIYRVTDLYGQQIGKITAANERTLSPLSSNEVLYIEADGGMILTRNEDWKEVKVGRIFKSSDCCRVDGKPGYISHSQYKAHLGDCKTFKAQMDSLLESYNVVEHRMVFISDGAPWLKNWVEDIYPGAVSILDYYHAVEHLYQFTEKHFKDKQEATIWAKEQEEFLLESMVDTVIENIKKLSSNKEAQQLIDYYESNRKRMDYKTYKQIGAGIMGSGAIESAHRTVVQKRMKLSGQRWGKSGAQNMLNLRVCSMNKQWNKIIELTKINFKVAA